MRIESIMVKGKMLYCSFCRKSDEQVTKLIAGPSVFICDGCVELCNRIIGGKPVPAFPGFDALKTDDLLKTLVPAAAQLRTSEDVLRQHVATLRKRDVTWTRIGEALGVSRQAAWERFSQGE
jgi:hypothetical protein